jgi:hypothetical protein
VKWLDRAPLSLIAIIAILLALAPFGAEPHLWQKLKMLFTGSLHRPIDILDLLLHGAPAIVLAVKLVRVARARPVSGVGR